MQSRKEKRQIEGYVTGACSSVHSDNVCIRFVSHERRYCSRAYRQRSSQRLQRPCARCGRSVVPQSLHALWVCEQRFNLLAGLRMSAGMTGLWNELPCGRQASKRISYAAMLCLSAAPKVGDAAKSHHPLMPR